MLIIDANDRDEPFSLKEVYKNGAFW